LLTFIKLESSDCYVVSMFWIEMTLNILSK